MSYIKAHDSTALFYRDWGTGAGAPILFLAAWALSSVAWQYQLVHLAENGVRCVAYDRRGHGRSDDPGRGYDYDTLADDLGAVIEGLDLHDVIIVAHSMAGGEAIRYLTRHGADRISRLVLIASTLPFPLRTDDNPQGVGMEALEAMRAEWRQDFVSWIGRNVAAYFGEGLPGCMVSEGLRRWSMSDMMSTSLHAAFACNETLTRTDFRTELPDIRVPTTLIHGDSDTSVPIETSSRRTVDLIPGSHLIVYQNAPHGLYVTHRDRLNDDLLSIAVS